MILTREQKIRRIIISASLVASFVSAPLYTQKVDADSSYDAGHMAYNAYSVEYLSQLNEMDYDGFDQNFINVFRNGKYEINGIKYDVSELYIVVTSNGNHVVKAGNNNYDILTGVTFNEKIDYSECLRKTTVFYMLYKNGIIKDENTVLDAEELKRYVDAWDLKNHYETPELLADKNAQEKTRN